MPTFHWFASPLHIFCLSMRGHRGRHRGCSAVLPSGVPAAASTIVAASSLAGASPQGSSGAQQRETTGTTEQEKKVPH